MMISVEDALNIVLDHSKDFGTDTIPLSQGLGRVLRETIYADRPMPPYDRVAMDGIAIDFHAFQNGRRTFPIAGIAAAGAPQTKLVTADHCLEAMTGASLPAGTDTVIRYEDLEITESTATIQIENITQNQNVHSRGSDRAEGESIIHPGHVLSSAETGVCASVGKNHLTVSRPPRAIVISTGDELVPVEQTPLPHQIRMSNVHRLQTTLANYQGQVDTAHVNDHFDTIVDHLSQYLEEYEVIILSGGVSKGKFDFLPEALEKAGVQKSFHRVAQRPGKPFWFGAHSNGTPVFAFPGNPVSSFMCMQYYFIPWMEKCLQQSPRPYPKAVLTEEVRFRPPLTYFLEVKVGFGNNGGLQAIPAKGNGSGDLANLVEADAFLQLPANEEVFPAGRAFPLIPYRAIL